MTLALRYAVRSDVGLLREGNEDSAYAGPHLLAVADGMGGHAAGEVASAATITTIAPLDAEDPGPDLVNAIADAVATANLRLQELIAADPAIEGMGTTLTALLWVSGYAALCHIGDSRAYLLREGQFIQITHDHTLVQSLVDEGKITEEDIATHPHRSLLLRALDGRTIAEPDLTPLETFPGDRYLLCSDGLSGVVTEHTLHQTLASEAEPDRAALRLVELAIKGGGPDNITCIVADVIDSRSSRVAPTWQPTFAGAAANGAPGEPSPTMQNSPATRAMHLSRTAPQPIASEDAQTGMWHAPTAPNPQGYRNGYTGAYDTAPVGFEPVDGPGSATGTASYESPGAYRDGDRGWGPGADDRGRPQAGRQSQGSDGGGRGAGSHRARHGRHDDADGDGYPRSAKRRWPVVTGAAALLVLLLGGGAYGFYQYNQRQFYVSTSTDGFVSIFQGTNQSVAGISMSTLKQKSTLKAAQLTSDDRAALTQTISVGSLKDAQQRINSLSTEAATCQMKYQELATWKGNEDKYQAYLTAKSTALAHHAKPPTVVVANPGPMPAQLPGADQCAPPSEFGIPATSLPSATAAPATGSTATASPAASSSAKSTTTAKPTTSASGAAR